MTEHTCDMTQAEPPATEATRCGAAATQHLDGVPGLDLCDRHAQQIRDAFAGDPQPLSN